ncbi:cyclic nucleotide-binding protein [Chryseotalea sanaruensis]|uniref:Cyclic nucleotide-binding protein n=1 Tax=Chryseotalea sanaruensis TaxID=2482724 RepID=A0A401U4S7_9BACT|nr:cyclic nucleotide-binding domain-containing protein [Chryseotalea sanaruensis]GCC49879.1 cyclic nucleotide-binding protein [Chryseotalea sanaruensis]
MLSKLYKTLGIEPEESGRMTLLLVMGFFMGMFIACLSVAAQSLFLEHYPDQEDLATAFVVSGLFALMATFIYNYFQNRIPFILLGCASLLTIMGLTALIEFGENLFSNPDTIHYIGFTLILPFTFITLLVFWGSFGRLFNLRESKRLLGSVDAGFLIASLIAFFSIPQILNYVDTAALYSIGLVSVTGYFLLFAILSIRFLSHGASLAEEKRKHQKLDFMQIFKIRYVFYMSIFVIITMVALRFVDFSFLQTTQIYFDKDYVPTFLSYFEAVVVIFSFLFQTFAADKIVSMYGMRVASIINPILTGLFTVGALLLGLSFGYTAAAGQSFVIFFIMIAMSKLVMQATREALDEPVMKLYMLPVDSEHRLDVQTKLEGTVLALGNLLAGALILLILKVQLTQLIYFTIFAIPMFVIWYLVANRLNTSYRQTLQGALSKGKERATTEKKNEKAFTVNNVLELEVNSSGEEKVIYGLKLMEKLEPAVFESSLIRLADNENKKVREFAKGKIQELGIDQDFAPNSETKSLALLAIGESEDSDLLSISPDKLMKLGKSNKSPDRILAAKLLRKLISQRTIFVLLELMRDVDPRVRYEALLTARKVKRSETWPVLIELLNSPAYGHHAAAALREAGEAVLPSLDAAFHKSSQSDLVMLRLVQIMGRIGGPAALDLLWKKADYPDKRIVKQILYTLRYINHKAIGREAQEVMVLLDEEIGKTMWNLAAVTELPKNEYFQYLRQALKEEIAENFDQITLLLSLLYDPQNIQLVRENIDSGDPDGITFALELMDIFVDNDLKPKLFPLFDDKPVSVKLEELQVYFPRETYSPIQVINYILNRDFNQNNRWTKMCAIHSAAYLPEFRVSRGLIAQLFNRDRLLQETAAWVIYNKDKKAYQTVVDRLPLKDKKFLDGSIENNQLLDGLDDGFFLGIEMVFFLKELKAFQHIHGVMLSDLVDKIAPLELRAGETITFTSSTIDTPLLMVAHGEVRLQHNDQLVTVMKKGDVYGDLFQDAPAPEANTVIASERSIVFRISLTDFYFVIANHHELVQQLIKNVTQSAKVANL